ncbi:glutathione S-transferase kappa 1 [Lentithecium fluviatile CBS 122367]|uniref:Glutathione S-transferase kappa n=1 Tax=Lentithecium fluviatile CBS 122367 TaxID=1168545 RepID=A0A6G1JPB0_9PLEO|nr:glutathione S-transferase kappa 1 [Lentithecium fluviatile CBS 122367]
MSGKITAYIDCVSPYSYLALLHLSRNTRALQSHDVEVDVVPVFLGGINVGSGNKPPWTLPAKAVYSTYDSARAKSYFGVPNLRTPQFFPILSLLPQRALVYIKATFPDIFLQTFIDICSAMWENGVDVSKPELLAEVLGKKFEEEQVREILGKANSPQYKGLLNTNTKEALDCGAFGCPWFWVSNAKGEEEPFFGSDRFHFMWQYLGLPWKDIELLPAMEKAKI